MDTQKRPKKLTLWEDSVEHYGNELLEKVKHYPVFLARRVVKSSSGIWSRYNTTILLHPTYPQATTLAAWAKTIQRQLIEYTARSMSPEGTLLFVPFEEESVFISDIQMQPQGQIFYIDGQLSLINEDQHFCSMACSDCKLPFLRTTTPRPIYCIQCERSTQLIPRIQFEVMVMDHTGSTVASISDQSTTKMLNLTVQEIYDICHAQRKALLLDNAHK
ncbi:uncharacterized protein LOC132598882 [Lycium barbarum]|uniref:uncharacterized protein LOC132598882 n=1 Tax=Lycium barbarum TaxID=112863 RepID=UPI00293E3962|nr:uncharacterized protein LOC132598882 [Lycium barbarum]